MVANPRRRVEILDSGLGVLGGQGGRGLTHRAVDARAGLAVGTTANYFPTRAALVLALTERAFERLRPDPDRLAQLSRRRGRQALAAYVGYVVERLLEEPELALALVEIRLEAARSVEVAELVAPRLRAGLAADLEFHRARELPGGPAAVLALHHLVNGLVLDRLTVPLDPEADPVAVAGQVAEALMGRRLTRDLGGAAHLN